ncbi:Bax inhibitor 1-related protein [Corchorus olitorius]|uniref:Bax inhibitor 1-related protein n=1 Tax=Corchorus olitorius TaxID=93759 RepID=A0A1R3KV30_9ROSI|nr:Bax inhibitor 1-related protein [Corchorus olitorius]
MAFALFESATIDLLIHLAIEVDPSVVVTALVITTLSFACFSGAALVARRREYIYLGGMLSSALFIFEVYFGLLVFAGYMVVDAREIIEKAHLGDMDYMKHALYLFTDLLLYFPAF